MKPTKLLYISAPLTSSGDIEHNVEFAAGVAKRIAEVCLSHDDLKYCWFPVVVHTMTYPWGHELHREDYSFAGVLELMRRCDAVLFCGVWKQSLGCLNELEAATEAKILRVSMGNGSLYTTEDVYEALRFADSMSDVKGWDLNHEVRHEL